MSMFEMFRRKKRKSVPDTLAVMGLKKALLLGMLSNPNAMEDTMEAPDEGNGASACISSIGSNDESDDKNTEAEESDLEKGFQDMKMDDVVTKPAAPIIQKQKSLSHSSRESVVSKTRKTRQSSKESLERPSRKSSKDFVDHLPTTSSSSDIKRSSFVVATFSKDVVKIRPDILKSIPLTTASIGGGASTCTKTYTSASSSDSNPEPVSLTRAQQYRRRKSVSLDAGFYVKQDHLKSKSRTNLVNNTSSAPSSPQFKRKMDSCCHQCHQYHESNHQFYYYDWQPHSKFQPPTYGPNVNQLPVPSIHPGPVFQIPPPAAAQQARRNFRSQSFSLGMMLEPPSSMESKKGLNRMSRMRRGSFQRQNSIDIGVSQPCILEETSTSSDAGEDDDGKNKSYLSTKRSSLKKRLRLKTLSSKSDEESSPSRQVRVTSL